MSFLEILELDWKHKDHSLALTDEESLVFTAECEKTPEGRAYNRVIETVAELGSQDPDLMYDYGFKCINSNDREERFLEGLHALCFAVMFGLDGDKRREVGAFLLEAQKNPSTEQVVTAWDTFMGRIVIGEGYVPPPKIPKKQNFIQKKYNDFTFATKNAIAGYLFISPFIIGFLVFMFLPILESLRMVFSDVTPDFMNNRYSMTFTGLENLTRVFRTDPEFNRLLTEELFKMAVTVPAIIVFSFFVSLIINQKFKGRGFVRSVFFLPVILSAGVMLGLETNSALLSEYRDLIAESNALTTNITGVLEEILMSGGVMDVFLYYVLQIVNQIYSIALTSGMQIIIFLSGLQTISPSMYEASKIEGATAWESFWKITFPMISSLILVNVVYSVIDYFVRSDNTVMEKVTSEISKLDYGFSSAMAWAYFLIVIVVVGALAGLISRRVYYYE
jgi:ABC-type sugar transport system permease subunit